jgi:hypothetical protein
VEPAAKLMEEAAANMYDHVFSGVYYGTRKEEKRSRAGPTPSRRGTHDAERFGSSMGGGQQFPMPCFQTALRTIVLVGLLAQKPFQRIAGFTNSMPSYLGLHSLISCRSFQVLCPCVTRILLRHNEQATQLEPVSQA